MADPIREPITDEFVAALRALGMRRFLSFTGGGIAALVTFKTGGDVGPRGLQATFEANADDEYFDVVEGIVKDFIALAARDRDSRAN
jgi:hypothetical protein